MHCATKLADRDLPVAAFIPRKPSLCTEVLFQAVDGGVIMTGALLLHRG